MEKDHKLSGRAKGIFGVKAARRRREKAYKNTAEKSEKGRGPPTSMLPGAEHPEKKNPPNPLHRRRDILHRPTLRRPRKKNLRLLAKKKEEVLPNSTAIKEGKRTPKNRNPPPTPRKKETPPGKKEQRPK